MTPEQRKHFEFVRDEMHGEQAQSQEPVAFLTNRRQRLNVEFNTTGFTLMPKSIDWKLPLYASPPQRHPLTDEQWQEIAAVTGCLRIEKRGRDAIMRILDEAAHGIGEQK